MELTDINYLRVQRFKSFKVSSFVALTQNPEPLKPEPNNLYQPDAQFICNFYVYKGLRLICVRIKMDITEKQQALLRKLPGIDHILELLKEEDYLNSVPKSVLVSAIRRVVEQFRTAILKKDTDIQEDDLSHLFLFSKIKENVKDIMRPNLRRVINGTGIVVHTNLGRSLLAPEAVENIASIATKYSNLEYDLSMGSRGSRYSNVEDIICEISGGEAAMVVNNNAGAVFLCLETLAKGKKVVVSRGELVEIGGSFRIPDVMAKSGGILKEVGTTNRTHLKDYEKAIEHDTGLLLKVHTSNYSIVGFTSHVPLEELVALGAKFNIPVMEDLGSGTFIDFSRYGMTKEPTVQESVAAGVDVISFSGDKLLGGPQAGIIVGKHDLLERIKKNPLTRALRIDKLTLAALESTMRLYRNSDKGMTSIPTLNLLTLPLQSIEAKAKKLKKILKDTQDKRLTVNLVDIISKAGGGSFPLLELPSKGVSLRIHGMSSGTVEKNMRAYEPPIIGRIEDDVFLMDLRTIQDDELDIIYNAVTGILRAHSKIT